MCRRVRARCSRRASRSPSDGPPGRCAVNIESVWEVLQGSVQGASHKDKDLPNQDSVKVVQPSAGALPIVAVVSDGHGSEPHFRSNAGSRLATERVAQILERFSTVHGEATEEEVKTQAQLLPQRIVEAWRLEVDAHLAEVPL
ncbi:hypothetical protein EON79_13775, partial [bacterium]